MSIGERIKLLRKDKKLTQADFGNKIGLKAAAIGMYENNLRNVSEQSITLISQAFNVNEEWLRTGKGEMYAENDESIVRELIEKYHMSENQQRIMYAFLSMDDEKREQVAKAFFALLPLIRQGNTEIPDIEAEVSAYRQELQAEEKTHESSPSAAGNGSSKRGA